MECDPTDILQKFWSQTSVQPPLRSFYCLPVEDPDEFHHEVLADDEHIVALRYDVSCFIVFPDLITVEFLMRSFTFSTMMTTLTWR